MTISTGLLNKTKVGVPSTHTTTTVMISATTTNTQANARQLSTVYRRTFSA
jgi:hypothetical protein